MFKKCIVFSHLLIFFFFFLCLFVILFFLLIKNVSYNINIYRCGKGRYAPTKGSRCLNCNIGQFQEQSTEPSSFCLKCPSGFNQSSIGESSCIDLKWKTSKDCRGNQFLDNNPLISPDKWNCLPCPPGTNCAGADVDRSQIHLHVIDNYWKCPNDPSSNETLLLFVPCIESGACLGGVSEKNPDRLPSCASGRLNGNTSNLTSINRLCDACDYGYVPLGETGRCVSCTDRQVYYPIVLYSLILVFGLLILVRLKIRASAKVRGVHAVLKRTILSHLQMCSIIMALKTSWPNTLSVPMAYLTELLNGASISSDVGCTLTEPGVLLNGAQLFYSKLLFCIVLPFVVIPFTWWYWIILAKHSKTLRCGMNMVISNTCGKLCTSHKTWLSQYRDEQTKNEKDKERHQTFSFQQRNNSWHSQNSNHSHQTSTRDSFWVTIVLFLYFLYPQSVRLSFLIFQCGKYEYFYFDVFLFIKFAE